MTVKEALISSSSYPISEDAVSRIAILRELELDTEFTKSIGESKAYELAYADVLMHLAKAPNIGENGVQISNLVAVRKQWISDANAIYAKHGDTNAFGGDRVFEYTGDPV